MTIIADCSYNINESNFLIIRMDSIDFALSTVNIDGICEFCIEPLESLIPDILLGKYCSNEKIIPIIDIKAYVKHPNGGTLISSQSRIIFINYLKQKLIIGLVVDAILNFYRILSKNILFKSIENIRSSINYYGIKCEIKLNGKNFPVFELEDIINLSSLIVLLKRNLHPKIFNKFYLEI